MLILPKNADVNKHFADEAPIWTFSEKLKVVPNPICTIKYIAPNTSNFMVGTIGLNILVLSFSNCFVKLLPFPHGTQNFFFIHGLYSCLISFCVAFLNGIYLSRSAFNIEYSLNDRFGFSFCGISTAFQSIMIRSRKKFSLSKFLVSRLYKLIFLGK